MNYIQRKEPNGDLETVDMFECRKEAVKMVREYRESDRSAWHYISQRPCNAWRDSLLNEPK